MILGIGCDIIKISRIAKLMTENEEPFLKKIFTAKEINLSPSEQDLRINYFAKRFAAKEAIVKALGTGFGEFSFHDIEITNNELGKPIVDIKTDELKINIHLSLADEKEYAIAYALIERAYNES